jgi:outer membrane protein
MMRKRFFLLAAGGLASLLLSAAPASLFAEEYTLDDLFRIALSRSEKLKVAEENLTLAETGKEKAFSYLLPRVTATGGLIQYSETKRTQTGSLLQPENATSWGVRVDETFSTSGRELTALEMTKKNVTKSRYDLAAIREDYLLRAVAAAYYNVLAARKGLEIAETNLERLTTYRNAAEVRLKIGEVTRTVLLRAEGELSGAKSDQLQAKNALELTLSTLMSNCGIKDPFTLKEIPAEDGEIRQLPTYQDQAIAVRSDLKGLEVQKQIAADQIKYAEGAFWPNLSLSAVYSGSDQNPASANLNRESIYGGVALSFPFFEGGLRKAEVAEAKARERQAALQYEDLKKSIDLEIKTAYLDLVTQKGILRFLEDQLAFARDNYRAVTRQFEFGLSNSLDVMDANTLLVTAERKWASALYNQRLAFLKMKKATGTLLKINGQ